MQWCCCPASRGAARQAVGRYICARTNRPQRPLRCGSYGNACLPACLPALGILWPSIPRMQVLQYMGDRQSRAPLAELGRALLAAALADALVRDELFCQVGSD